MPTFEELIPLAEKSSWKLKFGYTLMAVVEVNGTDYVIGRSDWIDGNGNSGQQTLGPMTLGSVLGFDFSAKLIAKIRDIEEYRPLDYSCFFFFGLFALFALLAEGLVGGTLVEGKNGLFEGIITLDEKHYAFSATEMDRPREGDDFLFLDGSTSPCEIL